MSYGILPYIAIIIACRKRGLTKSDLAREMLRKRIAMERFRELRRKALPLAAAAGYVSDEDIFRIKRGRSTFVAYIRKKYALIHFTHPVPGYPYHSNMQYPGSVMRPA